MSKKKSTAVTDKSQIDEHSLFARVAQIIETRKSRAGAYANRDRKGLRRVRKEERSPYNVSPIQCE